MEKEDQPHEIALSEGKCDLFNRSQGSQRGDLGLGESFCAGDREPLVGPVAPQRPEPLGTFEIPHMDGTILAATGQLMAIGTDPERPDRPLMPIAYPHALPTLYVPPAQRPVAASTDQQTSVLAPIKGQHRAWDVGKSVQALPTVRIPQEQFSTAFASATTGEPGAIRTPHHARDHATMPSQPLEQRAVDCIPHVEAAIFATAGQACAVRSPGYVTDHSRVRAAHPTLCACRHVPHLHPMHIAPAGKPPPIWTPGHAPEDVVWVVGVPLNLDTGPGGRVPQPDGIVPPATGQGLPIRTPCHSLHAQAMSAQHPGRRRAGHLPDDHQPIRAGTGESFAIRTPCHVVEADRVPLHETRALPMCHVPHAQGAIFTTTEQAVAVGVKARLYTVSLCPCS